MKEFIVPEAAASLTKTIQTLNKVFVVFRDQEENKKKQWIKNFLNLINKNPQAAWEFFIKLAKQANANKSDFCDPLTLFSQYQMPPLMGNKDHGVMYCKDFVIGLILKLDDHSKISYRLDYDQEKRLHINVLFEINNERFPFCVKCHFSKGRFGFSSPNKMDEDSKEFKTMLELTKIKFWLKMTLAYNIVQDKKNIDSALPLCSESEDDLFSFITGQGTFQFESLKNYVATFLSIHNVDPKPILDADDEKSLLKSILKNTSVRHTLYPSIFKGIAAKDPSKQLLSGQYNIDFSTSPDSDQRPISP